MRLVEATRSGDVLSLCFVDGDLCVRKEAAPSKLSLTVGMKLEHALAVATLRKMREAEADFAYMKYGERWREQVKGRFWKGEITEEESKMLGEAINGR